MDGTESRNTTVESKVIIHKSRGEVSLVEQLTMIVCLQPILTLSGPAFFLRQSWTGGGPGILALRHLSDWC